MRIPALRTTTTHHATDATQGPPHRPQPPSCLVHRLNSPERITIQDGSKSEAFAQKSTNPDTHLFACEIHLKHELTRRGATGAKDRLLYAEAVRRSKSAKDAVTQLHGQLSPRCPLRQKPLEELYPAYLPTGVGTHGNTTGNVAEVAHRIFDLVRSASSLSKSCMQLQPARASCRACSATCHVHLTHHRMCSPLCSQVRSAPSLYKSCRLAVEVFHRQDVALRQEYLNTLASNLCKNENEVNMDLEAPPTMVAPHVLAEFGTISKSSEHLPFPARRQGNTAEDGFIYSLDDASSPLTVQPDEILAGRYDSACSCGRCGNVTLFCKHICRCLWSTKTQWQLFVKPWQKVWADHAQDTHPSHTHLLRTLTHSPHHLPLQGGAWRLQVGRPWDPPTAQQSLGCALRLAEKGCLFHNLEQPSIVVARRGRPSSHPCAEEDRRAKSFMEELQRQSGMQHCLDEATVGAAACKNPGGKGTKKAPPTCGICGGKGHKRHQCPARFGPEAAETKANRAEADGSEAAAMADNDMADNRAEADGSEAADVANNDVSDDDDVSDDEMYDNWQSDNATTNNATTNNAVSDNDVADNVVADNGVADNGVADSGVADNDTADNDTAGDDGTPEVDLLEVDVLEVEAEAEATTAAPPPAKSQRVAAASVASSGGGSSCATTSTLEPPLTWQEGAAADTGAAEAEPAAAVPADVQTAAKKWKPRGGGLSGSRLSSDASGVLDEVLTLAKFNEVPRRMDVRASTIEGRGLFAEVRALPF